MDLTKRQWELLEMTLELALESFEDHREFTPEGFPEVTQEEKDIEDILIKVQAEGAARD